MATRRTSTIGKRRIVLIVLVVIAASMSLLRSRRELVIGYYAENEQENVEQENESTMLTTTAIKEWCAAAALALGFGGLMYLGYYTQTQQSESNNKMLVLGALPTSLLLHAAGLSVQWKYRNGSWSIVAFAVVGAFLEGTFLLWWLANLVLSFHKALDKLKNNSPSTLLTLLGLLLAMVLLLLNMAGSLLGDYAFRNTFEGADPDMWIAVAGIKSAKSTVQASFQYDWNEAWDTLNKVMGSLLVPILIYIRAATTRQKQKQNTTATPISKTMVLAMAVLSVLGYAAGAWCPVWHANLCFVGSFVLTPDGAEHQIATSKQTDSMLTTAGTRPNVIFIIHESFSGSLALNDPRGRQMMPYFQNLKDNHDDMYVFQHARTVSGNTMDAMSMAMSGLLPFTPEGMQQAFQKSIGSEFKEKGYNTASFTSCPLNMKKTAWWMIQNYLTANMDHVQDPLSANFGNGGGVADDRYLPPLLEHWLQNITAPTNSTTTNNKSFYAQFYTMNLHHPYMGVNLTKTTSTTDRYFEAMKSQDQFLQSIREILDRTGQLDNTIIIGTGDHGETIEKKHQRLLHIDPLILQPLTYMYVPRKLLSEQQRQTLRHNTDQIISTLDLFPTTKHILHGGPAAAVNHNNTTTQLGSTEEKQHCVTGLDLLQAPVPQDRVTVTWNYISYANLKHFRRRMCTFMVLSRKDKALYRRCQQPMEQFHFDCPTTTYCGSNMAKEELQEWKQIIAGMQNHSTTESFWRGEAMRAIRDDIEIAAMA